MVLRTPVIRAAPRLLARLVPVLALLVPLLATSGAKALILPERDDRSLFAEAESSAPGQFDDEAFATGPSLPFDGFVDSRAAAANTDEASATALGLQSSVIMGDSVEARGEAAATSAVSGPTALALGRGESFLDVVFQVETAGDFAFSGSVEVVENGGGAGFALVELFDLDALRAVERRRLDATGSEVFATTVTLQPSVRYALTAIARADSVDSGLSAGRYSLEFAVLPEAPTASLLALALGLVARAAARDARREGERRTWATGRTWGPGADWTDAPSSA